MRTALQLLCLANVLRALARSGIVQGEKGVCANTEKENAREILDSVSFSQYLVGRPRKAPVALIRSLGAREKTI